MHEKQPVSFVQKCLLPMQASQYGSIRPVKYNKLSYWQDYYFNDQKLGKNKIKLSLFSGRNEFNATLKRSYPGTRKSLRDKDNFHAYKFSHEE